MPEEVETVFVVDDDPSARKGLKRLISVAGFEVETYESAHEFLDSCQPDRFGCILLDVKMPDMTGPELHDKLKQADYSMPVIFLSAHADVPTVAAEMRKGAVYFLTKPVDAEELFDVIQESLQMVRESRKKKAVKESLLQDIKSLTPREYEVMRYVITGLLNKQIADELDISLDTVKIHRGRVMKKLGVVSVAALVRLCEIAGIRPVESCSP